jgi:hypothetical protein
LVVVLLLVGTLVYFLMRKPTEEEIVRAQTAAAGTARRASTSGCQATDTGEHGLPKRRATRRHPTPARGTELTARS